MINSRFDLWYNIFLTLVSTFTALFILLVWWILNPFILFAYDDKKFIDNSCGYLIKNKLLNELPKYAPSSLSLYFTYFTIYIWRAVYILTSWTVYFYGVYTRRVIISLFTLEYHLSLPLH